MRITAKQLRAIEKTIGHDCVASIETHDDFRSYHPTIVLRMDFTLNNQRRHQHVQLPPAHYDMPSDSLVKDMIRKGTDFIMREYLA